MNPTLAIVDVHGAHKVHTEFHANPEARKTIILVNGSLATTASFAQTVKYLAPHFNLVLYDPPYAGQSRIHNPHRQLIAREDEAAILLDLIEHYQANHLLAFSWGGLTAVRALARRPAGIDRAVIASLSPGLSPAMIDYLRQGQIQLAAGNRETIGSLINGTIGKHLPSLAKRYNQRHLASLTRHEHRQMQAHIEHVLQQRIHCQTDDLSAIGIPVLFVNGALDEYTSPRDAALFGRYLNDCRFATVEGAGHFLDMEHKDACRQTRNALLDFLQARERPTPSPSEPPLPRHPLTDSRRYGFISLRSSGKKASAKAGVV